MVCCTCGAHMPSKLHRPERSCRPTHQRARSTLHSNIGLEVDVSAVSGSAALFTHMDFCVVGQGECADLDGILVGCLDHQICLAGPLQDQLLGRGGDAGDGFQLDLELRHGPRGRDPPLRGRGLRGDPKRDIARRPEHGGSVWSPSQRIGLRDLPTTSGSPTGHESLSPSSVVSDVAAVAEQVLDQADLDVRPSLLRIWWDEPQVLRGLSEDGDVGSASQCPARTVRREVCDEALQPLASWLERMVRTRRAIVGAVWETVTTWCPMRCSRVSRETFGLCGFVFACVG